MGSLSPWHLAIVAVVFLVLFGSKKLPDAARGLGRSMRIFKSEVSEMQNEGRSSGDKTADDAPRELPNAENGAEKSATVVETDSTKKSA